MSAPVALLQHNRLTRFLLPWAWGISSQLLQQSAAAAPYLGQGYLLTAAPPDLACGVVPLGPPAPLQPRLLGRLAGYNPWGCKESDTTKRLITYSREGPDRGGGG